MMGALIRHITRLQLTYGTAASVAIQALEALEDLHGIGYLHRDVKPANYTIGRPEVDELRKIYVLDFGMCRKFAHEDGTIKKPRAVAEFRGTLRYAPVSCHSRRELCRQDDCESWLYMVVEFTKGGLPWRHCTDMKKVGDEKRAVRTSEVATKRLFGGCPREYIDMLRVIDAGKFFDEPDYNRLYSLLRQAITNTGSKEYPYDWEEMFTEQTKKGKIEINKQQQQQAQQEDDDTQSPK
ncbi:hypothetical protein NECAME_16536 [Necator americanus]|uniref:non-specific serine/threonine protein kinase n=1 Tax=Necator americanus TaxID=51031 RepID=W2TV79_NECAM|nr:hypothetical protein NECAME_16536 [Necator americanus]ETN86005.1 hypothetical protein NECAME_16536 [Necator americanus]